MKKLYLVLVAIFTISIANAQSPTINSFTPVTGSVGTLVTITGINLSSPTAFTIGGTTAIVVSNTGTTLVGMVMTGAVTGTVSVTTTGGTATGNSNFSVLPTPYPYYQQGNKLIGIDAVGNSFQGNSVSISADGNTAIVGGYGDNSGIGAAWIYTRSGDIWTQQGSKLVGTGAIGASWQGASVSISADGNTAIVGGYEDNNWLGAAWVYTRVGGMWTQQGNKLVGTGTIGVALQGWAVAISADGNTAIIGGYADNSNKGAAWVYTRSAGVWSQQGSKLVGTDTDLGINGSYQGGSVSISADGNTAIVGGNTDNGSVGAAFVYTRSAGVWTQQGNKLVATDTIGLARQGISVALSADGNTALVGGSYDNNGVGATFVYTRSAGVWSQQGHKLVGTGATGAAYQGGSVTISADGNTAVLGGGNDNNSMGAIWVYTRSAGVWSQKGNKLVGTGAGTGMVDQGGAVSLSADGNTVIVGGSLDNNIGASWIFTSAITNSVQNFTLDNNVSLYPNPAKDILTIETTFNSNKEQRLEILNLIGQTVFTSNINKKATVNTSAFANGVYILKISSDKETMVRKFVKE